MKKKEETNKTLGYDPHVAILESRKKNWDSIYTFLKTQGIKVDFWKQGFVLKVLTTP